METISINQVCLYNTQRVTDEQSRALFSARHKQFNAIMTSLARNDSSEPPQHHLVIAQRGMGKTTLLKRVEVELRSAPYDEKYEPLLFPEEQYNVKDLSSFWLNCIDVLADQLERKHENIIVDEIDTVVSNLMKISDSEERARETYKFIRLIPKRLNRQLVLLIDNLNIVFLRLSQTEQHTMRSLMCENGAPVIIGASPVVMEEVISYEAPFYDAFRIHVLEKLTLDELNSIIVNLAEKTDAKELKFSLHQFQPRIKALYHLAGGNPRTAVLLFRQLSRGFSNDINDDLEAILDELTPVFKGKFEELSEQSQIIIDSIALAWSPVTLEALRTSTGYENGQLSPQLKRLVDTGWIEKPPTRKGKGGAYEISERIFNIWYLMRRSSRRQKKSVYCLSNFMEVYYGEEIDSVANYYIDNPLHSTKEVITALALARLIEDKQKAGLLCEKSRNYIYGNQSGRSDLFSFFDYEELYPDMNSFDWSADLRTKIENKEFKEALHIVDSMSKSNSDHDLKIMFDYTSALLYKELHELDKAESIMRKLISDDSDVEPHYIMLSEILIEKNPNDFSEVNTFADRFLENKPEDIYWLKVKVKYYDTNKRYNEEIEVLKRLLDIAPNHKDSLIYLGNAYASNKEFEKSLHVYSYLYDLYPDDVIVWSGYVTNLVVNKNLSKAKNVLANYTADYKDDPVYTLLNANILDEEGEKAEAEQQYLKCLNTVAHNVSLVYLFKLYFNNEDYGAIDRLFNEGYLDNKDEMLLVMGEANAYVTNNYEQALNYFIAGLECKRSDEFKVNLIRLYRDKLNDVTSAQTIFEELCKENHGTSDYLLEEYLFELKRKNLGNADQILRTCIQGGDQNISDLIYAASQAISMNLSEEFIDTIHQTDAMGKYATVIYGVKAALENKMDDYLAHIPSEYRELTADIADQIKYYQQ